MNVERLAEPTLQSFAADWYHGYEGFEQPKFTWEKYLQALRYPGYDYRRSVVVTSQLDVPADSPLGVGIKRLIVAEQGRRVWECEWDWNKSAWGEFKEKIP